MIQIRYWIEENRKKIFIFLGFLLIICVIGFSYFYFEYSSLKKDKKKIEEFPIEIKEANEEEDLKKEKVEEVGKEVLKLVTVDIKGAITSPGVYEVEEGKRVQDVIHLANGLKENADVSLINLSKKVEDEMVIVIYTREEILAFQEKNSTSSTTPIIECPKEPIINDACINNEEKENQETVEDKKVSINQSDLATLMTLPGIGESKARAIISYREQNGGFQSIDQLKNVSGIGEAVYTKLEPFIIL